MRLGIERESVAMTVGSVIGWTIVGAMNVATWSIMAVIAGCLLVIVAAIPQAQGAGAKWPGPHAVEVLSVKDADTVDVRFRDGPCGRGPCPGAEVSIRVRGIDAPEVHLCREAETTKVGRGKSQSCAQCPAELVLARQAVTFAKDLLSGAAVRARDIGPDAYNGRYVARLEVLSGGAWRDYGELVEAKGLAVRYDPEADKSYVKAKPWCARDDPPGRPAGSGSIGEVR